MSKGKPEKKSFTTHPAANGSGSNANGQMGTSSGRKMVCAGKKMNKAPTHNNNAIIIIIVIVIGPKSRSPGIQKGEPYY